MGRRMQVRIRRKVMVKKRIVSVLIVLIFALGVALAGIFASGFGGDAENAAGENGEEVTAGIRWKLTFYERKDLRNTVYRVRKLYKNSELLESLEKARNDAGVELNAPWAEAYYEFLEEVLKKNADAVSPTGFRLVYIDADDVPELLIMKDSSHVSGVTVCTYYQNKVVEIGAFGSTGEMRYVEKQGKIDSYYRGFGEQYSWYFILEDGKAEELAFFHSYPDLNYDDYSVTFYEIDEKSVTEKIYNEKLDEFRRDDYVSIRYDDAVFVDDLTQLRKALAQEIEALELKSSLTPQQVEVMEAYEAFLEEYAEDFMEKADMVWEDYEKYEDGYRGVKFTLIYLDNDEIPELVISEGWSLGHSPSIYTYSDKEVVCIGQFGYYGEIGYVEKEGILLSEYERHLQGHYDAYQVKGTKADNLLWIDEFWHWDSEDNPKEGEGYYTYEIHEKEADEDEYMAKRRIYEDYKEKEKRVVYNDCFLMLDGNVRGNLNQAMAKLVFEENPFFYPKGNTLLSADIKYEASETWDTINGELQIKWLKRYDNGDLYKLSVEGITEGFLGPERKNIYLYVTPDEIYRLWSFYHDENGQSITFYDNDSLLMETFDTDEKLIENGELVCCMERIEDELGKEDLGKNEMGTPISEIGKHFSIIPEGERIAYSRYDTKPNGETDFYENFVWERGKGLVEYRSGFRAEAEILYIENISIKE